MVNLQLASYHIWLLVVKLASIHSSIFIGSSILLSTCYEYLNLLIYTHTSSIQSRTHADPPAPLSSWSVEGVWVYESICQRLQLVHEVSCSQCSNIMTIYTYININEELGLSEQPT